MSTVVIAPDGFGGTLTAREAATAMAEGWRDARPDDRLVLMPMSDGGEGLLDVVARADDEWCTTEVAGPLGHPVAAGWLLRADGSAVIESARACGTALASEASPAVMLATTYGVGQLLDAARERGVRRISVGLGGSATVDGGAGAVTALGLRPTVEDGSGLKVGGGELVRVAALGRDWLADWSGVEVELLADVTTPLLQAAAVFGPQKGATPADVRALTDGLRRWADVVERDLLDGTRIREVAGTGAAGGLGYALAAALGARLRSGSGVVGELVGLPAALADADVVLTGEGSLDATTAAGKVVTHVATLAAEHDVAVRAVVGRMGDGAPDLDGVEVASPHGPSGDPARDVRRAARRCAVAWDR